MPNPFSDYWLERYLCAELPPRKRDEIERALAADPALRARLAELQESNRAILQVYPSAQQIPRIQARAAAAPSRATQPARFPVWAWPAGALALTAALAVWVAPLWLGTTPRLPADLEITRLKGMETGLTLYRKTQNQPELLKPYAFAQRGDLLQIGYVSLTEPYGVIVSLDGRGTVTQHFPETGQPSTPKIQTQRRAILPKAYELDDAPRFERFFLVTSAAPMTPETVLQAARTLAQTPSLALTQPLPLERGFHQYSVVIQKNER